MLRLPTWAFVRVAARLLKIDPAARSSMWADLQASRVTEIDDLCGAVMRLGAQNNIATPRNATIQKLIEAHTPGWRYSRRRASRRLRPEEALEIAAICRQLL